MTVSLLTKVWSLVVVLWGLIAVFVFCVHSYHQSVMGSAAMAFFGVLASVGFAERMYRWASLRAERNKKHLSAEQQKGV